MFVPKSCAVTFNLVSPPWETRVAVAAQMESWSLFPHPPGGPVITKDRGKKKKDSHLEATWNFSRPPAPYPGIDVSAFFLSFKRIFGCCCFFPPPQLKTEVGVAALESSSQSPRGKDSRKELWIFVTLFLKLVLGVFSSTAPLAEIKPSS